MKKIISICLSLSLLVFLPACGGGDDKSSDSSDDSKKESNDSTEVKNHDEVVDSPFAGQTAIALRNSAISDIPGGNKEGVKWLKNFSFGQQFEMTGDSAMIGNGEYYKLIMKTEKGDLEGWASTWSIVPNAKRTITVEDLKFYKNSDVLSVTSDKIDAGTIVIVVNEEVDGFYKFATKDKGKSGWVKGMRGLSEADLDIEIGSVIRQIRAASGQAKLDLVNEALDESSYMGSSLYKVLKQMRNDIQSEMEEEGVDEEAACGEGSCGEGSCGEGSCGEG